MRRLTMLVTTVLIGATLSGLPGSALAGTVQGTELRLTVDDVVTWPDECVRVPWHVTVDSSDPDWHATVTIQDPSYPGYPATAHIDGTSSDERGSEEVCPAGTSDARARARVSLYHGDSSEPVETISTSYAIDMRARQSTRLTVRPVHVRHGFWRITGTLTKAGRPWVGKAVSVQVRYDGRWRNLYTKQTVRRGKVHFTARPEAGARRYPLRLHSRGTTRARPASSARFRIWP